MRLVPYHPGLLPALTQLVNAHMRFIPPAWEMTAAQVAAIATNSASLWEAHFAGDDGLTEPQPTLCVVAGDTLLAAAQWDTFHLPPHPRNTSLNWIVADPDHPAALTLLLDTLLERARAAYTDAVYVARFAFGVGWMGIPLVWPHLITAFHAAGFEIMSRWRIMTGRADIVRQTPLPAVPSFSTRWRIDEAALEWELLAYSGEEQIGECQSWGIPPHFGDCPAYDQWTTVEWLGVEEGYRQHGIGAYLMAEQLRFQAARGVRHVMVWTETDNLPTLNLNAAFGFTPGPECHVFTKSLA